MKSYYLHYIFYVESFRVASINSNNNNIRVAFQCIDLAHLLWTQVGVDIFLVDWERPHAISPSPNAEGGAGGGGSSEPTKELAVSVWRTYLVANEWNEMQVTRKTNLAVQVLVVVFILKVCRRIDNMMILQLQK